jgi:hypothetical protein
MRRVIQLSLVTVSLGGLALSATACGNAAESGLEQLIESQGGGDVDLDLNSDGGFSMQTEEGGMSIDEDGNFVITDASGSVVSGSADVDSGEFNIETEDGSFSSSTSNELPDDWPSEVPRPDGLLITSVAAVSSPEGNTFQVSGTVTNIESFVSGYVAQLESMGFSSDFAVDYQGEESWAAVFEGPYGVVLNVVAYDDGDSSVGVMVFPTP